MTTRQGQEYTTGCLLDCDYIKNHYRLIAADLSRQTELDADPKAIQKIEIDGQLRKLNNNNNVKSMFIFIIYTINQFKICSKKIKAGTILRFSKTNFEDEELPHELFLAATQTTKIRNALANNISTDIKLSKLKYLKKFSQVDLLVLGYLI